MVKVTSLELSEKLKEAGAKQESDFFYYNGKPLIVSGIPGDGPSGISCFDCTELLERLPWRIKIGETLYTLGLHKIGDEFWANYEHLDLDEGDNTELAPATGKKTPSEALGELYHWGLANGHIKA